MRGRSPRASEGSGALQPGSFAPDGRCRMLAMRALTDYDPEELAAQFADWGCKPSHAARLLHAFYLGAGQVDLATLRLGKTLQSRLDRDIALRQSHLVTRTRSADGTEKLVLGLARGGAVESVLMLAHDNVRAAGCISSQIGCAMGCDFCASTRGGLERNLDAGEIVEQFLHLRQGARQLGRRLATIVFMGMGEPMHNLSNVMAAIRRIALPGMGELGGRQITVSTVGIVPGIDALAAANLNVHLAISLHAPDDLTRQRIVPMTRRYGVADIVAAARRFQDRTGRIVNMEYCLLSHINDSDDHARRLVELLRGFRAHVNLIPYNSIGPGLSGTEYQPPPPARLRSFYGVLLQSDVVVHLRQPRGDDVNAACGQLRSMLAASRPAWGSGG